MTDSVIDPEIISEPAEKPKDSPDVTQALQTTEQALSIKPIGGSSALAAQLVAGIHARYLMAERHPREMEIVKKGMLQWCAIPDFAEAAIYKKPIGRNQDGSKKYIEGLSIRFAEMAVREMGNILVGSMVISQDDRGRIIRQDVTDLERNIYFFTDSYVPKTVERRKARTGQKVIGERLNSEGQIVYEVEATEDELDTKSGSRISKVQRTLILKIIPPDIKIACEALCRATQIEEAKRVPEEVRRKLIEGFASKGISEPDLQAFIGKPLEGITAEETVDLRAVFLAIVENDANWPEIAEAVKGIVKDGAEPIPSSKAEEIKTRVAKRREEVQTH